MRWSVGMFVVTLCVSLALAGDVMAQGRFLRKGEDGIGIGAGISTSDHVNGLSTSAGYSVRGIVDFQLGLARGSLDDPKTTVFSIGPSITVHALRQVDDLPIQFSVSLGYSLSRFSGDVLDQNDWEMTGSALGIRGGLSRLFVASPRADIIPSMGIDYTSATVKVRDRFDNSVEKGDDAVSFDIGLTLALRSRERSTFLISSSLTVSENADTFHFGAGYVVGFGKKGP